MLLHYRYVYLWNWARSIQPFITSGTIKWVTKCAWKLNTGGSASGWPIVQNNMLYMQSQSPWLRKRSWGTTGRSPFMDCCAVEFSFSLFPEGNFNLHNKIYGIKNIFILYVEFWCVYSNYYKYLLLITNYYYKCHFMTSFMHVLSNSYFRYYSKFLVILEYNAHKKSVFFLYLRKKFFIKDIFIP